MIYRKQTGFDEFHCIADQCPKSCCEGWQIVIDDNSLQKYQIYSGVFENRLKTGINKQDHCFRQQDMRCHMLTSTGLCDLQSALGEEYLCDTCRQYPRHIEEFLDLREYSLSLSCPEVVRMLVDPTFSFALSESEDDDFDDPKDFDDFDPFLFDELTFAREKMIAIASDPARTLQDRSDRIAAAAFKLQSLYDEGEIFEMGDISYDRVQNELGIINSGCLLSYEYMLQSFDLLLELEVLESSWTDIVQSAKEYWLRMSADSDEWMQAMFPDQNLSSIFEKVFQSLLFTYFCGSIYDGQIYARAMIAVMSVRWIMMISFASPDFTLEEIIYLFSRETEHSDLNINALISFFEEEL